jgi:hypothetical protein
MSQSTTTTTEISKNVFLTTKKMETNAQDGAHTIYLYTVFIFQYPKTPILIISFLYR